MLQRQKRQHVSWSPQWGPEYVKWTTGFIRVNQWRVDRIHDFDDLMQDAYLVFSKVAATYPRVIDPKYFFNLYKRAMVNKMHDRSCAKTRRGRKEIVLPEDVADFFIGRIGEAGNAGYAAALLNELPEEMKMAVTCMTSNQAQPRREKGQPRENLSRRICRQLGLPTTRDPVRELKELFSA